MAVMMYIRFPLSLRQVEDLLHERGIGICYETLWAWWNRFGLAFAVEIKKKRSAQMRGTPQWHWHLDEVFVRINGEIRAIHASAHNHFNQDRHLNSRQVFKLHRSAALAEWRQFAA